jgi:hypothetical protein
MRGKERKERRRKAGREVDEKPVLADRRRIESYRRQLPKPVSGREDVESKVK